MIQENTLSEGGVEAKLAQSFSHDNTEYKIRSHFLLSFPKSRILDPGPETLYLFSLNLMQPVFALRGESKRVSHHPGGQLLKRHRMRQC